MHSSTRFRLAMRIGLASLAAWVGLSACSRGDETSAPRPPRITVPEGAQRPGDSPSAPGAAGSETLTWDLALTRPAEVKGPRMAEVFLRYGEGLRFIDATPMDAVYRAGKELVTQARREQTLRLVVYSGANLTRLDSGQIARLSFARTGDGPETLDVLYEQSAFAPAALYARPETLALAMIEEGRQ